MNALTKKRFDNLDRDEKITTLANYVQELNVNCKTVLVAACNETNNHVVSNKAISTIMDTLPRTSKHTPKRHKAEPQVTLTSASKQSTTCRPKPRDLFKDGTATSFEALLNNPALDSDDEYDEEIYPDGKPIAVIYSKNINHSPGVKTLSTAETYNKMEWDSNYNVIIICNPGRNTNPICCFETVANLLDKKLPLKFLKSIKNISNPNKFNFQRNLDRLKDHDITFTKSKQTFEDIFSGQTTTGDVILIVSKHRLHNHEDGIVGNPKKGLYVMCSIVIPRPPHLVLTFSSTNQNCWMGKSASNRTGVQKAINQKTS